MNTLVIAVLSIALSVAAQFSLKAGMSSVEMKEIVAQPITLRTIVTILTDKSVLGGLLLYAFGAVIWLAVLSRWDVSKAYPLVGLGFAATVAIGLLAGEHVTFIRVTGVALICAGVFLVAAS